jgi:hypothetical protein
MSIFIEQAETFLIDQRELSSDPHCDMMIDTVAYLLENARGYTNRKSTDVIVSHLRELGYDNIKREDWQVNVMGKLRDNGIFIGSKKGGHGGIFLIVTKEDASIVHASYGTRIEKEARRLQILNEQMQQMRWLD